MLFTDNPGGIGNGGAFQVDQLATFTGFEVIRFYRDVYGDLFLGSQSLAVIGDVGANQIAPQQVYLGSGAVTCVSIDNVYSNSPSNWNAGISIDGDSSFGSNVYLNSYGFDNAVYDLTTNTLSHIAFLVSSYCGANLTVKINSAVAGGIANFDGLGTNKPNWSHPTQRSIYRTAR